MFTGLTKEDNRNIGFVISGLYRDAIDYSDLREWCFYVVSLIPVEECPAYIFDLMDFEGPLAKITKVVGFTPDWNLTPEMEAALFGIAIKRGRQPYDMPITEASALAALDSCKEVVEQFRENFPFISLE